jgi:hypothetical protein
LVAASASFWSASGRVAFTASQSEALRTTALAAASACSITLVSETMLAVSCPMSCFFSLHAAVRKNAAQVASSAVRRFVVFTA